ncbi:MAG: aminotransferase class III-fold pyridoxal phosphate-dependent enzyme [Rhodospirillaceae bacterium]|nr:aminotransferase class III-fold pyridoxal phosphate-dependent enzyme [Rhodospirillaceae bacterium]
MDRQNLELDAAITDVRGRFLKDNPKSAARHEDAKRALPGGNTRAVLWYEPFPLTLTGGKDCRVTDLDGHTYVDFVSEYTAGLYGHSNARIAAAIKAVADSGWVLGGPNPYEARLGQAVVDRYPAIERVRFCNSGTEANLMALSTARAVTGRAKILAFDGGYHGGILTFAHGGSPLNAPYPFIFAQYNDMAGTAALIRDQAKDLAAVILEPMMGGGGCIAAKPEFLAMLRKETEQAGILLIFDEVMASRLSYRGYHGMAGIKPDMVTLGKYIGGGCSFGAFGGRADILDRFDPASPNAFGHGGTFNNNIFSMAAGFTGFTEVLTEAALDRMNGLGDELRDGMNALLAERKVAGVVTGVGSIMNLHFVDHEVRSPHDVEESDPRWLHLWQLEMMLKRQYVTPRGMIALSLPISRTEIVAFLDLFADFLDGYRSILPKRT